jgi:hypothetical protein
VMKESISAAASYVRSRAVGFGIEPPLFDRRDIHVHVPEGATPKDGPSAGVAMATAIVSIMTGIPVRHDVAMTGEITLRGRVLPIGGLKEKLLAAARGGIKTVLIPEDNAKDLTEISDAIKGGMDIIPVARLDDVISKALVRPPVPIVWEEDTKVPVKPDATDEAAGGLTAHGTPSNMTTAASPRDAAFLSGDTRLAPDGPAALNRPQGRLAQLVRASRLHREGRRFESVTAYQTNRQPGFSGLPSRQRYAAIMPKNRMAMRVGFASRYRPCVTSMSLAVSSVICRRGA